MAVWISGDKGLSSDDTPDLSARTSDRLSERG
jgi:hypothetical protein